MLSGALTVACVFPWVSDATQRRLRQRWSRILVSILGVRVDADLGHAVPGSLLVANHISFLDIYLLNAVRPVGFISKAEVREWPVIGWLAATNDTIFLKRGSRGHARLINEEIARKLGEGKYVGLFPEGTTTDGTHLLNFHAALLQPALNAGRPIVPIAISYWEPDGTRSLAPRYDGDISLGQCIRAIASRKRIIARVLACPALGQDGSDRRTVAAAARAAISAGAALPPPHRAPERLAGLPDAPPSGDHPTDNLSPAPAGSA